MAEDLQVGVGGVHKTVSEVHVGVGGVYKEVSEMHVGVGGAWKQFYTNLTASFSGLLNFITDAGLFEENTSTPSVTVNISNTSTLECTLTGTGTSKGIQKNGTGPYSSSQTVSDGDTLKARLTTGGSSNTIYTCIIDLEGYDTATFQVETAS